MDEKKKQPPIWQQNTGAMLVLYSILSAICGVFIIIVIQDHDSPLKDKWELPIIFLSIATFLFLFAAEAVSEAVDQNDIEKYIATHVLYNVGVVLLIWGIRCVIYYHYYDYFNNDECRTNTLLVITISMCFRWAYDTLYLIFISNNRFNRLINDKEGVITKDRSDAWDYFLSWTNGFLWIRRLFHGKRAN